jgi:hypothetical protein
MSKFKSLTTKEINELDELLNVANSILKTTSPVIKGNPKAATIVGTAIGGATGAAIATSAGTVGIASATLGVTGMVGLGIASTVALPVTIIALIGAGIGLLFGKNKAKKKEQQKQANYCKELAEKQQKIFEKYETLKREHERTDREKDDIIKKQQEKVAEYEAIFEALKKKRNDLEDNLAFA